MENQTTKQSNKIKATEVTANIQPTEPIKTPKTKVQKVTPLKYKNFSKPYLDLYRLTEFITHNFYCTCKFLGDPTEKGTLLNINITSKKYSNRDNDLFIAVSKKDGITLYFEDTFYDFKEVENAQDTIMNLLTDWKLCIVKGRMHDEKVQILNTISLYYKEQLEKRKFSPLYTELSKQAFEYGLPINLVQKVLY